jgi:hypothetical protein
VGVAVKHRQGPITAKKGRVEFLEVALQKRITKKGLDRVHLFGTINHRHVIPLAVRMTKIWEYSGITDPNWVSTAAVTNDEVSSRLDVVLNVGNQWAVSGPQAFDKEHPPDPVSFSPLLLPARPRAPERLLTLACFSRDSVIPNPFLISRRGQRARPNRLPR